MAVKGKPLVTPSLSGKLSLSAQVNAMRKTVADIGKRIDALETALGGAAPSTAPEKDKA